MIDPTTALMVTQAAELAALRAERDQLQADALRHERELDQVMRERDNAEAKADKLTDLLAEFLGIEVGEHSSANDPWQNAIDEAEYQLAARATERQRPAHE